MGQQQSMFAATKSKKANYLETSGNLCLKKNLHLTVLSSFVVNGTFPFSPDSNFTFEPETFASILSHVRPNRHFKERAISVVAAYLKSMIYQA